MVKTGNKSHDCCFDHLHQGLEGVTDQEEVAYVPSALHLSWSVNTEPSRAYHFH